MSFTEPGGRRSPAAGAARAEHRLSGRYPLRLSRQRRRGEGLRTGDIAWTGSVRIARRTEAGWTTTRVYRVDRALAGWARLDRCAAGICWDTDSFRLPRNDDSRFGVTVRLARSGSYRAVGAVRLAGEAFQLGPWFRSDSYLISR